MGPGICAFGDREKFLNRITVPFDRQAAQSLRRVSPPLEFQGLRPGMRDHGRVCVWSGGLCVHICVALINGSVARVCRRQVPGTTAGTGPSVSSGDSGWQEHPWPVLPKPGGSTQTGAAARRWTLRGKSPPRAQVTSPVFGARRGPQQPWRRGREGAREGFWTPGRVGGSGSLGPQPCAGVGSSPELRAGGLAEPWVPPSAARGMGGCLGPWGACLGDGMQKGPG